MKNRLEISKELLADEGVLLVSISGDGQAYLKVLMDDIFSKNNFVKLSFGEIQIMRIHLEIRVIVELSIFMLMRKIKIPVFVGLEKVLKMVMLH